MNEIFVLTLRALARGRRLLLIALLLLVPSLLSVAYAASEPHGDGKRFAIQLFGQLVAPVLLPLVALLFASSALGSEVEDRTLVYLTLRPVSRLSVVVAKLLASFVITVVLVELALSIMDLIAARGLGDGLGALLLAGLGGSAAYCSLFLLVGLAAPRRALLIGFAYVLAWEGLAAGLSTALATLSVRKYVEGALHAALGASALASAQPSTISGTLSAVVLAAILIAGIGVSTWQLHRIELP